MRLGVLSSLMFAVLLFVSGCAQTTTTTTTEEATTTSEATTTTIADAAGKTAMEKVCSQCHGLRDQQGKNITPEGKGGPPRPDMKGKWMLITAGRDWAVVVKRMKETNKCEMTAEEQESISTYMNSVYGKK